MDRRFGNYSALRKQIDSSSPELRALEAKLQACAVIQDNRAAIAEKEFQRTVTKMEGTDYTDLVKQMDDEERLSAALSLADHRVKMEATHRVLKDQISEKAASKTKDEAERVIEMMAELDETKKMEEEIKTQRLKKQANQENTSQVLQKQTQLRKLLQEENILEEEDKTRSEEEYNLKLELKKEMERQETEIQRLLHQQRELHLVQKLEHFQMEKDTVQETRKELEILERSDEEKKLDKEKEKSREEAKLSLIKGLQNQIRYKEEKQQREHENEDKYRKLILEVMAEESRLEQLAARARRQRQLDHRHLAEHILRERRAMRARIMEHRQQREQEESSCDHLRKEILEEEEKLLLLKHAPHLMPFLTPELRARLRKLI